MLAKAGDVYCVYNFHLKKYTACQITKIEEGEKKPQAVLLSLDWSGKQPLREEETIFFEATLYRFYVLGKKLTSQ